MPPVIIEKPILNSLFQEPTRHFRFSDEGITNEIVKTRRLLEYWTNPERERKLLLCQIEAAWSSLYSAESRPFNPPSTAKIAIKVINHYGNEVLKVYEVK